MSKLDNIKIGVVVIKDLSRNSSSVNASEGTQKEGRIDFVDRASHQQFIDNIFSIFEKDE